MKQLSDRFDEIGDAGQRELDEGGGDPAFSAAPVMVQLPAASGSARASRTPRGAPLSPRRLMVREPYPCARPARTQQA